MPAASSAATSPGRRSVYLDINGREEAWSEADATLERVRNLIEDRFPDFFGEYPSAEHPNGTDPAWATRIVRPHAERDVLMVITEEPDPGERENAA